MATIVREIKHLADSQLLVLERVSHDALLCGAIMWEER